MRIVVERATEIEKSNLNLFNKMRAIIRTKHSDWQKKMINRTYFPSRRLFFDPCAATHASMVPRERVERIGSAISSLSARNRRRSKERQMSARSDRSSLSVEQRQRTIHSSGSKRPQSRSIQSLNAER